MPSSVRPITPRWAARGSEIPLEGKSKVATREWDEAALDGRHGFTDSDLLAIGLPAEDVAAGQEALWAGASEVARAESALFHLERALWMDYLVEPVGLDAAVQEAESRLRW